MRNAGTELESNSTSSNPRRVAAGKANRAKRKGLTPEGRERLRAAALANAPWRYSTGPTTAAGKAQAARNGKRRQVGPISIRELRAELAELRAQAGEMAETRDLVGKVVTRRDQPAGRSCHPGSERSVWV